MERIKVSENFYLDEFVDPHTYFNNDDHGRSHLDERLFALAQKLRELHGAPLYINTWWSFYKENETTLSCDEIIEKIESGTAHRKWSGLRTERCNIGAPQSAHKLGKAIDTVGKGKTLFKIVKKNARQFYELGLRRLEDVSLTPTWLHMDTLERNTFPNSIRVVDLRTVTEIITW